MAKNTKARYWVAVGYPENMVDDWENEIDDLLQLPYAYCVHDKDLDKSGAPRKEHMHLILAFPNTTTYNHVLKVVNGLSADGKTAFNDVKPCISVRGSYDYLTHDTDGSRKNGKHLYYMDGVKPTCGNNFDIGSYEQLSLDEKREIKKELCDFVIDNGIENLSTCYTLVRKQFADSGEAFGIFMDNIATFDRLCRGNYLKAEGEREAQQRALGM